MAAGEVGQERLCWEVAGLESGRVEARCAAEARAVRAEAKAAALERRMAELQAAHKEALAACEAASQKAVATVRGKAEQAMRRASDRMETLHAERLAVEAKVREADAEAAAIRGREAEARKELSERLQESDARVGAALDGAHERARAEQAVGEAGAKTALAAVRAEQRHTRELQEESGIWRETLTGVSSARRDEHFRKAQRPRALPFDLPAHETVFDGFGGHGKRPFIKTPRGFKAEMALRLYELGERSRPC